MPVHSRSTDAWTAIAGFAFAVLLVAFVFTIGTPESSDPATKWADYFSDSGHRTLSIVSGYLGVLAAFTWVIFYTGVHQRVAAVRPAEVMLSRIGMSFAVLAGAGIALGALCTAAVAAGVEFGDTPVPDGEFARQFEQLGFGFLMVMGALSAAVAIASLGAVLLREHRWAAWLSYLSFIVAIALIFAPVFIPLIALPIWAIVVGIMLLMGTKGIATEPTSMPA